MFCGRRSSSRSGPWMIKIPQYARRDSHVRGSVATFASCRRMFRTLRSYPPPWGDSFLLHHSHSLPKKTIISQVMSCHYRSPSRTGTGLSRTSLQQNHRTYALIRPRAPHERTGDMTRHLRTHACGGAASISPATYVREGARGDMTPL